MRSSSIVRLETLCRTTELHLACSPDDVAEVAAHAIRVWNRPASTLAAEPLDVVRKLALIFRSLDLDPLVALHHVMERDDEGDVPLPAVAGVVPADAEASPVVLEVTLEIPAFTGTVFLLDRRDGYDDGFTCAFELELDRPTGIFVPIEEREHEIELARATNRVERQLVLSHTTLLCVKNISFERGRKYDPVALASHLPIRKGIVGTGCSLENFLREKIFEGRASVQLARRTC